MADKKIKDYNLVSLAFYLGRVLVSVRLQCKIAETLDTSGFLVWEFPTVYISQKLRLAKYLGANVIVWGIFLMLHATATTFGGFFALRFFLGMSMLFIIHDMLLIFHPGMCESCVAPILILIISMFYKKDEQV